MALVYLSTVKCAFLLTLMPAFLFLMACDCENSKPPQPKVTIKIDEERLGEEMGIHFYRINDPGPRVEQELSTSLPAIPSAAEESTGWLKDGTHDDEPVLILLTIEADGKLRVEVGEEERLVVEQITHDLSDLDRLLELLVSQASAEGKPIRVELDVDSSQPQQSVTNLLNCLAGARITEITFKNMHKEE